MKKIDNTIKVVFFTATDAHYPGKNIHNVVDKKQCIVKPISLDDLLNQVKMRL